MLEILAEYAEGSIYPNAPRPEEHDPLLAQIDVERNPRGGITVSVPTGTNVLIRNT